MLIEQFHATIVGAQSAAALEESSRLLWRAYAEGHIGDGDTQALSEAIERRKAAFARPMAGARTQKAIAAVGRGLAASARRRCKSPARDASRERRRRCAASGTVPPQIAAQFTQGETAVLSIIAAEVRKCGACALPIDAIAAKAGVGRTTAQNAVRQAERLGILRRQERRQPGARSWTNVLTVIGAEWRAWLRLAAPKGGGLKKLSPTNNCLYSYAYARGRDALEPLQPHPSGTNVKSSGIEEAEAAENGFKAVRPGR